MSFRCAVAPLSFLLCLLGPARLRAQEAARPETFALIGVVRDETSGRPMPGVLVVADSAGGPRTVTDSTGAYRIAAVPRGSHVISARRIGYYVERREITVSCPIIVVDERGRPVADGEPCDPSPATLNFSLRPQTIR